MQSKIYENDAKQFAPFDALSGFRAKLKTKEVIRVNKIELAEEELETLEDRLNEVMQMDKVEIISYKNHQYFKTIGKIRTIDKVNKNIILTNEKVINIRNILDIREY